MQKIVIDTNVIIVSPTIFSPQVHRKRFSSPPGLRKTQYVPPNRFTSPSRRRKKQRIPRRVSYGIARQGIPCFFL
jgi:hypothetical protein